MTSVTEPGPVSASPPWVEGILAQVGLDYFRALTDALCTFHGADIAFIASIMPQGGEPVRRLLTCLDGGKRDSGANFPLAPATARHIMNTPYSFICDGARARFPHDPFLEEREIEGLAALCLSGEDRTKAGGLIVALSKTPFDGGDIMRTFELLASRTRAEFLHHRAEGKLKETISQALLLNYSKSMFMANISHELRAPIGSMVGYAALLRDSDIDKKTQRTYANHICTAGDSLLTLVGDIMSLAMLEISDETAKKETFNLMDIARTGRRLIEQQAATKNLTLKGTTSTDAIMVTGDAGHTKKALMNLLTNAVKYTSKGSVEIAVTTEADGSARLSVIDTGIGMTDDEIREACEPLGSFTHAYDMHQEGAKLGLPITMLLMERQGAKLVIESKKGAGTRAHLTFPAKLVKKEEGDFI